MVNRNNVTKIVEPLKTENAVKNNVSGINVTGNIGLMSNSADNMKMLLTKYQEIQDKEAMVQGENLYSSLEKKALDFEGKLQYDKAYYQSSDEIKKLNDTKDKYIEEFQKKCKANGIDMSIANSYIEAVNNRFTNSSEKFLAKHNLWKEERNREYYIMGLQEKANNNSRRILNGDYEGGVKEFYNLSNEYFSAAERGDIKPSAVIGKITELKQDVILSDIESLVNKPEGLVELQALGNMSFKEFDERYSGLNLKINGKEILLSEEDFKTFQRGISGAVNRIKARNKANEEASLYEIEKQKQYIRENPVDATLKNMVAETPINENFEWFALSNINNKYGTSFSDLDEAINMGFSIPLIGGVNSKAEYYNSLEVPGELMAATHLEEANSIIGGQKEEYQMAALDGMYGDGSTNFIPGYTGTKLLEKPGSAYAKAFSRTYSTENKKILASFKDVTVNTDSIFNMYKENKITQRRTLKNFSPQLTGNPYIDNLKNVGKYTELDIAGVINGLEIAGINGDTHAGRTAKDVKQLISDYTKTLVFSDLGGILDEGLAKEIGAEKKAGMLISDLSSEIQQKIFNYYTEDPGRIKKLFGSENPIKQQARADLEKAVVELIGDTQTIDIGNGRFLNISPELNGADIAKGIIARLNEEDFYTEEGLIVPGDKIQVIGKSTSNDAILMYNKQPVYTKNGKQAIFNLSEVE